MLQQGKWLGRMRGRNRGKVKVNYHVSSWGFVAWWLGLLVLHCINFGYYVGVTKLYNSFEFTFTYRAVHSLSIGIDNSQYAKVSAIHATIAAIHAFFILLMVISSIHAHKLAFQPDLRQLFRLMARNPRIGSLISRFAGSQPRPAFAAEGSDAANHSDRLSSARQLSRRVTGSVGRTGSFIFARDGLLGVDSVYFDHILLVRELVETGLQSYQVYRMSQLLPRLWLIRFYVALLVANCWAVPLLHRYYRDRETTRRMLCLLCDAVLDMISSIGISLIIFGNYVPQYNDPHGFGFPFPNWFDDYWLANIQQEFQMMLVASWGDMISRIVFALGLLQCMDAIKEMLTPVADLTPAATVASQEKKMIAPSRATALTKDAPQLNNLVAPVKSNNSHQPDKADESSNVEPKEIQDNTKEDGGPEAAAVSAVALDTAEAPEKTKDSTDKHSSSTRWERVVHFIVHVVGPGIFVLWGCAILIVHLVAETHYSDAACGLRLKPWFSSKPGCSIIEVNCHDIQSTGHDATIVEALDSFDPERATRVVFRHCPSLVMTPKIQEFKNTAGLKIYNSTVVTWGEASAITGTHHQSIRSVFLVRTFFPNGELPLGLQTNDFPPLLVDFITCVTNIRLLPDDLDTKWAPGINIALEFSQMAAVPDVLIRLKPTLVSLVGCPITSVPAELFELQNLNAVLLGRTLVQELPRNVTRVSPTLNVLFFQHTNVTTMWSWMDRFIEYQMLFPTKLFNAYNTPYCQELQQIAARNLSNFSATRASDFAKVMDVSTPEKLAYALRAVDCTPGFPSHFPLPLEDAVHGLH